MSGAAPACPAGRRWRLTGPCTGPGRAAPGPPDAPGREGTTRWPRPGVAESPQLFVQSAASRESRSLLETVVRSACGIVLALRARRVLVLRAPSSWEAYTGPGTHWVRSHSRVRCGLCGMALQVRHLRRPRSVPSPRGRGRTCGAAGGSNRRAQPTPAVGRIHRRSGATAGYSVWNELEREEEFSATPRGPPPATTSLAVMTRLGWRPMSAIAHRYSSSKTTGSPWRPERLLGVETRGSARGPPTNSFRWAPARAKPGPKQDPTTRPSPPATT